MQVQHVIEHVIEHVEVHAHAKRAMHEHAHREFPREACGLLAGALDHHVLRYVAMTNMARGQADYAIDLCSSPIGSGRSGAAACGSAASSTATRMANPHPAAQITPLPGPNTCS